MRFVLLALAALTLATPAAAQDGSETAESRTPENAIKFLNRLASEGKFMLRPATATIEYHLYDVACGDGNCWAAQPKITNDETMDANSSVQFGELINCKTVLTIKNSNPAYLAKTLEKRSDPWVHTWLQRYSVTIPGSITRNHWITAVQSLENHDFDWSKVTRVQREKWYSWTLLRLTSAAPTGGIRLHFFDNAELASRAELAIDVIVKSCDPLADSAF